MSGVFGIASKEECISDLFYGTDYHSHLGTEYGGIAVWNPQGFDREIHSIRNAQFRSAFEGDVGRMMGTRGIGGISDYEPQPLFQEGIQNAQEAIKGSCSLFLLTDEGIYAARDRLGRTALVIGEKEGSYAVASETCSFPNTDFEPVHYLGPGEIVLITEDGFEQLAEPRKEMQICAFLWVSYGFPASSYEGLGVEGVRNRR